MERSLVERMRMEDPAAYEAVFKELAPSLYRLAYGITQDEMEAQDVVQDVLVAMMTKLTEFRERSSVSTWLYRVAVNASLDRVRARKRKGEVIPIEEFLPRFTDEGRYAEEIVDWSEAPLERLLNREARQRIQTAIRSLPEDQRVVLVMKDIEGLALAEIAKALDLSLPAVKSRLHRARLGLRGVLASYFQEEGRRPMERGMPARRHKYTCREIIELLCEYLEGDLPLHEKEELDRHMEDCPPCLAFLRTYQKTSQICRTLRPEDIPRELRDRLERFLKEIRAKKA